MTYRTYHNSLKFLNYIKLKNRSGTFLTPCKVSNPFQNKLACDVKTINSSPDLFIPADKMMNLYKIEVNSYEKLLQDSITTKYQKSNGNIVRQINLKAKQLAKNLKLDNRIEQLSEKPAFITLKDHKLNFTTNPMQAHKPNQIKPWEI